MTKINLITSVLNTVSAPIGRLLISFIFLMSGLNKIGNYANTSGWMESMGVSSSLLPLVIVGWLYILVGFYNIRFNISLIFIMNWNDNVNEKFSVIGGYFVNAFSLDKNRR